MASKSEKNELNSKYKQLTQREHVLLRPETYISTTNMIEEELYSVDDIVNFTSSRISKKKIKYSPAFLKIFDEALVNATDQYIRTGLVKTIEININREESYIEIRNDGPGIPVQKNKDGVWIPEMIFFNFLSGTSFDDSEDRFTGGRNGIGIKATATFSKKFIISTFDGKNEYIQESSKNLSEISKPTVTKNSSKKEYVSVRYYPDLEKFGMSELSDDVISLFIRRVYESIIYCGKKVKFYFNGTLIPYKSVQEYFKLITSESVDECFYEVLKNGWEVCVSKSISGQFEHSSVVNGICTYNGGTHMNWVSVNLSKAIVELFPKKYNIGWGDVKNHLFIFVMCRIPNPTFNSQSKDQITNYISKELIGDSSFSDKFVRQIYNSSIVKDIIDKIELKNKLELSKLQSKKVKVEKLVDANQKDRSLCELFIFEGDSAGQPMRQYRDDHQGFFCLRGKFINSLDIDTKKIMENKEAFGLMQAIGLKWGQKVDVKDLRFSKIIIASDADVDGDCITAQLLNFFSNWPELFEIGMIYKNVTPLIIVEDIKSKKEHYFYEQVKYDDFYNSSEFNSKVHVIHYKKGIGSLDPHQFRTIIKSPILIRYSMTDHCVNKLNVWFGKNADLRKIEMVRKN